MPKISGADIAAWSNPSQTVQTTLSGAIEAFHVFGPRFRFIKTLPLGCSLLDVGAGDGSLMILRDWPQPARTDIEMFAWAGERRKGFDRYAASEIGWWPTEPPKFGGMQFDAILSANFIEHIEDPLAFVRWASTRLTARGRIYLEWPHPQSIHLPSTNELAAAGVTVMVGAYHDDMTHQRAPPDAEDVASVLRDSGHVIVERGFVRVPFFDRQLAIHARRVPDTVSMTLAYWSYTGWCQYLVSETARD
ncbi:MAG TPA: class I SAM-dependent methyltransferase [Stellaceae bacterium]|nr:class I SAM-dependent methyltransferase [Stellaceae bacterium]